MTSSYPIVDATHNDIAIDIIVHRIDETNPISYPPPSSPPPSSLHCRSISTGARKRTLATIA